MATAPLQSTNTTPKSHTIPKPPRAQHKVDPSPGPAWKLFMKQAHMSVTCSHVHVCPPQLSTGHLLPACWFVSKTETTHGPTQNHAGTAGGAHFVSDVDPAEAEGAEVGVGLLHRWLDRLAEHFLHKLADVRPHLFHCLKGYRKNDWTNHSQNPTFSHHALILKGVHVQLSPVYAILAAIQNVVLFMSLIYTGQSNKWNFYARIYIILMFTHECIKNVYPRCCHGDLHRLVQATALPQHDEQYRVQCGNSHDPTGKTSDWHSIYSSRSSLKQTDWRDSCSILYLV